MSSDTHCLAYRAPNGEYYYIPTEPEARKWRGPYPNAGRLEHEITGELGLDVHTTWTTVMPLFLRSQKALDDDD